GWATDRPWRGAACTARLPGGPGRPSPGNPRAAAAGHQQPASVHGPAAVAGQLLLQRAPGSCPPDLRGAAAGGSPGARASGAAAAPDVSGRAYRLPAPGQSSAGLEADGACPGAA